MLAPCSLNQGRGVPHHLGACITPPVASDQSHLPGSTPPAVLTPAAEFRPWSAPQPHLAQHLGASSCMHPPIALTCPPSVLHNMHFCRRIEAWGWTCSSLPTLLSLGCTGCGPRCTFFRIYGTWPRCVLGGRGIVWLHSMSASQCTIVWQQCTVALHVSIAR